jgi:hypothetical protein
VDEDLLLTGHPSYIDPLRWDPMLMKFTEYFSGAQLARPSSLARGWDMPRLATEGRAQAGAAAAATPA